MARRGVDLTSTEDTWEVRGGHDDSGMGRLRSGSRSWALRAFPLVDLPEKVRNGNCEQVCGEKLILKKSSLSG